MQKKTLYERLLNSKTYGNVVSLATCCFHDTVRRDLTKRETLGEVYNQIGVARTNLGEIHFNKDSEEYKELIEVIKKGEKLLAKYNYQHTGCDYLHAIDNDGYNPVFDGVNDDETDLLVTRQIFIKYFEAMWEDNYGYPHNESQFKEVWNICMDVLEEDGLKIDRDWKPTRAEKKKYIIPREQEPERYL